jgi:hypothetical protein
MEPITSGEVDSEKLEMTNVFCRRDRLPIVATDGI